jgi:hypothetical protein
MDERPECGTKPFYIERLAGDRFGPIPDGPVLANARR